MTEFGEPPDPGGAFLKAVAFFDSPADVAAAAFAAHVEKTLLHEWRDMRSDDSALIAACRRNYLIPGTVFQHPLYEKPAQTAPALILQLWFAAATGLQQWLETAQSTKGPTLRAVSLVKTFGDEALPR